VHSVASPPVEPKRFGCDVRRAAAPRKPLVRRGSHDPAVRPTEGLTTGRRFLETYGPRRRRDRETRAEAAARAACAKESLGHAPSPRINRLSGLSANASWRKSPTTRGSRRRPGVFLVHVRPMNLRAHDGLASIIIPGWNQLEDTLLCLPALVRHPIASGSSRRVSRGPANPAPRMKRPCGQARHELRRYMAIRYPARYRNAF